MNVGINCPYCRERPIQTARSVWVVRGRILAVQYGSLTRIGCARCVRREVGKDLLKNLVLGPWGLLAAGMTPFALLQNIVILAAPNGCFQVTLASALRSAGVNPDDVVVDSDGYTGDQRSIIDNLYGVLGRSIWADGKAEQAELTRALEIIKLMTNRAFEPTEVVRAMEARRDFPVTGDGLTHESRLLLLRIAADIFASDGFLAQEEVQQLELLGQELGVTATEVDQILHLFFDLPGAGAARRASSEFERATDVLGVGANASVVEIKVAYRAAMMRSHPDRAAGDRELEKTLNQRAQELNWAYEFLAVLPEEQTG